MKVLLLTKEYHWCNEVKEFLFQAFGKENVKVYSSSEKYRKFPIEAREERGNLLISFLSPWIVPKEVLENFTCSINFHPGPPEYPGTGCYNFALYEEAEVYGVTCHHITPEVDAGPIIKVIRFPIYKFDTVKTLRDRSLSYLLVLFYEILDLFLAGKPLSTSDEKWKRKAYTRKDLEELCQIKPEMPLDEIKRRIKAVTYPGMPGAFVQLAEYIFELKGKKGSIYE